MVREITYGIEVIVNSNYKEEYSFDSHFFSYTITIINNSKHAVHLQSRHWFIKELNEEMREVQGIGVVGETPILLPGENYQYSSAVNIDTEIGYMYGYYTFVDLNNAQRIEVNIPKFDLICNSVLN